MQEFQNATHSMWAWEDNSLAVNAKALVMLAAFDYLVAQHTKARWFACHTFANFIVVITGLRCVLTSLNDPLQAADSRVYNDTSMFGSASIWPVCVTNTIHVYHMLAFKLTPDDYFHHLMFIPTIGFFGQYWLWGAVSGYLGFFISGLPGGIDYFMLTLVKHGLVPPLQQKRVCACLNVYLRGPFIVIGVFIVYMGLTYDHIMLPTPIALCVAGLSGFNSLYYTKQSIANYAIVHTYSTVSSTSKLPQDPLLRKKIKAPQATMS